MTKKPKTYPVSATNSTPTKHQNERPVTKQVIHQQTFQHSGPLPDPASLDRYNQIVPDAAERIIKMAELNAAHVRNIEILAINAEIEDNKQRHMEVRTGQLAGLISVITSFLVAAYALYLNHTGVAGTICGVTVTGLVAAFITGKMVKTETQQNEKNDKP